MRYIFFAGLFIFYFGYFGYGQDANTRYWIKLLQDNSKSQVFSANAVHDSIGKSDTASIISEVIELEKAAAGKSERVQTRVLALKARLLFYKLGPGDSLYVSLMKNALQNAYQLDEPFMIAEFSRWYGEMLNSLGNQALAAQYCMNALKIQQDLGFEHFLSVKHFYLTTAELLFRTRNYGEAVACYLNAFNLPGNNDVDKTYYANSLNTLGIGYLRIKKYDSSIYYLAKCMEYVNKNGVAEDWYYIASDNRFDPYLELKQYDSCRVIADGLYKAALPNDSMLLMSACYMYARIAIWNGKYAEGLKWSLQSESYGRNAGYYLTVVYYDIAYCYEKLNQMDKALPYYKKEQQFKKEQDERNKKANASFLEAESEFQRALVQYKQLQQDKKSQLLTRNLAIAGIMLLSAGGLVYLTRRRRKSEIGKQEAEQQSHYFETKFKTAEEQLAGFKNDVAEMNLRIETLQQELNRKMQSRENIEKIDALSRQMILTEKGWNTFKNTFDSVYPLFFTTLKTRFPDITNAEQRMAALIRLNFDNKHIASMLGISQDSVHKTRYRLRKRFNGDNNNTLEQFISSI